LVCGKGLCETPVGTIRAIAAAQEEDAGPIRFPRLHTLGFLDARLILAGFLALPCAAVADAPVPNATRLTGQLD
jgi:hypothetical protein